MPIRHHFKSSNGVSFGAGVTGLANKSTIGDGSSRKGANESAKRVKCWQRNLEIGKSGPGKSAVGETGVAEPESGGMGTGDTSEKMGSGFLWAMH